MNKLIEQIAKDAGIPNYWINSPEPERQNGEAKHMLQNFAEDVIAEFINRLTKEKLIDKPLTVAIVATDMFEE